ncbi:gfo/Idh/MocA family oxidoreductase [Pseudorhizobium endolithicum]|uniref:Gfo/Idh/MocA family oxidoreductase n=2 Tax=Pseudorhizobium endolithicum TaxID=1191678 RepID=A0ABN7JSE2_9HYPH|nr:Gfo/Idh/MocA family oxidoreductase [Pseudorhizobium endolithicum]CAD7038925.1 gfo/Idh/MocA family oxidoreductase [Pseudorhizobium endolithicum]
MRIGVIGLGMASVPHAQSLHDMEGRVKVAAAFSPSADRREAFARRWGMPVVEDVDTIFDKSSIDAVLILTPPNTHRELVERAAASGQHVLLEKPLEVSFTNAEALVKAAEKTGVTLAVVLQHRFRPVSVALSQMVSNGRLGEVVSASAKLSNWRPQSYYDQPGRGTRARDGGGVLLTQGIHTLDLLISVAGLPVEAMAYAVTTPVHRMETEDLVAGAVRFENGAIGTVSATTCAYPGVPDSIEVIGTKGMARIEGATLIAKFHDGSDIEMDDGEVGGGAGADPMAFSHMHHRAVIEDFVDAVQRGRPPRVSGREALKVHRLIGALLRSAETGRREPV